MAKPTTKPPPKKASLPESVGQQSPTVAEVACDLIRQQYDCVIQQEQGVLADQDPEYLHLKQLQDNLGKVQDAWILRKLLLDELGENANLPDLEKAMQDERAAALANWETLRHRYLDLDFRCQLHQMILEPSTQLLRT